MSWVRPRVSCRRRSARASKRAVVSPLWQWRLGPVERRPRRAVTTASGSASPTRCAPGPGSRRPRPRPRPAGATAPGRTAVDPRGPWPGRTARSGRGPGGSAVRCGPMAASAGSGVLEEQRHRGLGGEHQLPGQQPVGHTAGGIDVGPAVDVPLAQRLLGGHERRRALDHVFAGEWRLRRRVRSLSMAFTMPKSSTFTKS